MGFDARMGDRTRHWRSGLGFSIAAGRFEVTDFALAIGTSRVTVSDVAPNADPAHTRDVDGEGVMDSARSHQDCLRARMLVVGLCWLTILPLATAQQASSTREEDGERHARQMAKGLALFKSDVRPLLVERCLVCHGGAQTLGNFDLSNRDSLIRSGKLGQTPSSSRLLKLIRHEQEPHMPFQQPKLPEQAINNIARWIELVLSFISKIDYDHFYQAPHSSSRLPKFASRPTCVPIHESPENSTENEISTTHVMRREFLQLSTRRAVRQTPGRQTAAR